MKKQRLLKLADLLEKEAEKEDGIGFNMYTWGRKNYSCNSPFGCKTDACALGLAALSGIFKRAGLDYYVDGPDLKLTWHGHTILGSFIAEKLFGISNFDAHRLFYPSGSNDTGKNAALMKAKEIRAFVAKRKARLGTR